MDPPVVFGMKTAPYAPHALPLITYDKSMSMHINGEDVVLMHYPNGHTDGDTVVWFKTANVVHLGDHFFFDRFPFVDVDSGGSVQGLIDNVAAVIATVTADTKIIPGHGPLANVDDLKRFHRLVVESSQIVTDAMKAGKTLDEIKKAGLPEKFKAAGTGFIKTDFWIETVHRSYSKK
jgi:cyclase